MAITLALHFCDLVHIAGFGYPDSANKKQTIHYYEQITLKSMAVTISPCFSSGFLPFFPWDGLSRPRRAAPLTPGSAGGPPVGTQCWVLGSPFGWSLSNLPL